MAGVLARVLWDTGCSDQLIHPDFGWELIRRGAAWRYCDPLYMNHGDASKTKGGAPAIIQVCAKDIVLVHNGDTYRMEDGLAHRIKLGGATEKNVLFFSSPARSSIFVAPNKTFLYHFFSVFNF